MVRPSVGGLGLWFFWSKHRTCTEYDTYDFREKADAFSASETLELFLSMEIFLFESHQPNPTQPHTQTDWTQTLIVGIIDIGSHYRYWPSVLLSIRHFDVNHSLTADKWCRCLQLKQLASIRHTHTHIHGRTRAVVGRIHTDLLFFFGSKLDRDWRHHLSSTRCFGCYREGETSFHETVHSGGKVQLESIIGAFTVVVFLRPAVWTARSTAKGLIKRLFEWVYFAQRQVIYLAYESFVVIVVESGSQGEGSKQSQSTRNMDSVTVGGRRQENLGHDQKYPN